MTQDLYFIIGVIIGTIYLLFCIVNIFFNITSSTAFTYDILCYDEEPADMAFGIASIGIASIGILISMLIVVIYPIFIFSTIVWALSKLKKAANDNKQNNS